MMMRFGMNIYEQGSIVLVPFPFSDLSATKVRPVLVLSNKKYNKLYNDYIVCGITTNLNPDNYSIIIDKKDVYKGRLRHRSRIKVDSITFLEKSIFIKEIDKIKLDILKIVLRKINSLFEPEQKT